MILLLLFQFCLAFKGSLDTVIITFNVKYKDKSGKIKSKNVNYRVEFYSKTHWNHLCVNMYDFMSSNNDLNDARKPGSSIYVASIRISRNLLVDDIWIGQMAVQGTDAILKF